MLTNNQLVAKIEAINSANKIASEIQQSLAQAFAPYVGDKILKKDGSLRAKFEMVTPQLPHTTTAMVYFDRSDYSLRWMVKTNAQVPNTYSCVYHEVAVYIGVLNNGYLESVDLVPTEFKSNYTVEEVKKLQQEASEAKEAYDTANRKLWFLG